MYPQPESTIEKIYKEIEKLFDADNNLIDILAVSGLDSEAKYTIEYLSMLEDMKELQGSLHRLLDNFNSVINDIEYEVSKITVSKVEIEGRVEMSEPKNPVTGMDFELAKKMAGYHDRQT